MKPSGILLLALGLLLAHNAKAQAPATAPAPAHKRVTPKPASALDLPTTAEVVYQILLGEVLMREQQFQDAYSLFNQAARESGDSRLYKRAAEAAWRAGQTEQALNASRQWADLSPEDSEATHVLTQIYATLNRPREAVPYLRRELARTPDAEKAATIAALERLLLSASNKQAALDAMRDWLQAESARPEAQIALARAGFAANRPAEAWQALSAASAAAPGSPRTAMLAIEHLERNPEHAIAIASTYARHAKALDAPTVELMRKLAQSGRMPQALSLAEETTRRHGDQPESWLLLGNLQDQANQPELAEKAYLQAVKVAANTPLTETRTEQANPHANSQRPSAADAALIALAATAERKKDYLRAENFIAQISREELQNDARVRLVASALRAKDMRTAWALVNGLPESSAPQRALKYSMSGQVLRTENKLDQSFSAYERAVAESPGDADLLYEASFAAERVKQWDRMETLLRQVIELKPDFAHAYNSLGYTLADRGTRLEEAVELIQKALSLTKDDPFITDSLGWAYYRMGRKDEALRELQRAYKIRPDAEIAAHLGEVLWEMGRKDDAIRTWKDALAAHESALKKSANEAASLSSDVPISDGNTNTLKETLKKYQVGF